MLFKGLKFGMLLQFAVGPMCLLVFNTAGSRGLANALVLTAAIALVDALYIILAGVGVARFLENAGARKALKIFGGAVLILFGLNMTLGTLGISILPNVSLFGGTSGGNIFLKGLLLTASNPLTIVFWGGVFTTQLQDDIKRSQIALFGAGCVLATLLFLSFVSLLGLAVNHFLNETIITVMNFIVGLRTRRSPASIRSKCRE